MNKREENRKIKRIRKRIFIVIPALIIIVFVILGISRLELGRKMEHESEKESKVESETESEVVTDKESEVEADKKPEVETNKELQDESETVPEMDTVTENQDSIAQQKIKELMSNMTLDEKILQMFMITPEALTGQSEVNAFGDETKNALEKYPVGGLIYFAHNLETPDQTRKMLTNTSECAKELTGVPLFLSVDEEGGKVTRIASNSNFKVISFPDMKEIGDSGDLKRAYEVGCTIGTYLADLGFNLDFAPDVDVLTNEKNKVIGSRAFSSDPQVVTGMGMEVARGLKEKGIYSCVKHFPGHGATDGDTHKGYSYTNKTREELLECELIPFQEAAKQKIPFIMVSHISIPNVTGNDLPASMSEDAINILRNSGYEGIIITDALNMGAVSEQYKSGEAAVLTIQAGVDILLMPEDFKEAFEAVKTAVLTDQIKEDRIDDSVYRILRIKLQ